MRNYLIYLLSPIIRTLLGIAVQIPITTYFLSPRDFGSFAVIAGVTALITAVATPSPSWVLNANFTTTPDRAGLITTLLAVAIGLHIAWAIPFFLLGPIVTPLLVSGLTDSGLHLYFALSILAIVAGAPAAVATNVLILQRRAKAHTTIGVVAYASNVTVTVLVLVIYGPKLEALFIGPIAQNVVASTASVAAIRSYISFPRLSTHWLTEIYRTVRHGIPSAISDTLVTAIERVVVGRSMSLDSLAYYTHSQRYRQIMLTGLMSAKYVITADAVEAYASGTDHTLVIRGVTLWAIALNFGGIICALFATDIVTLLTHGKFTPAGPMVFIWWITVLASSIGLPYAQYLLVQRYTRIMLISGTVSTAATTLAIAILVPELKYWGLFAPIICFSLSLQLYRRHVALRLGCPSMPERAFILGALGNSLLYVLQLTFHFDLAIRIGILLVATSILAAASAPSMMQYVRGYNVRQI